MKQIILFIMMTIVLASIAQATSEFCQDAPLPSEVPCQMITPVITCSDYTYTIYNTTTNITNGSLNAIKDGIYKFTFNQEAGNYIIRLCDNSTREIYVEGDDNMASLSITLFILSITGAVFALGMFKKEYIRYANQYWHELSNMIIRRALFTIGFYLLAFSSTIFATFAISAGIDLSSEMFMFMTIFGWAGYICALITITTIPFSYSKLKKIYRYNKRMGEID